MTDNRWAGPSILGYLYQFEYTILRILEADASAQIRVEGVEDLDILSENAHLAVQIKYHEGKKYSSSRSIRDPIERMLLAHAEGKGTHFTLYAHFRDGEVPPALTVDQLKYALSGKTDGTSWERWSRYEPEILTSFLRALVIISAPARNEQLEELITRITEALSVGRDVARNVYYPVALEFVAGLAVQADPDARMTRRSSFLAVLRNDFAIWNTHHQQIVGRAKWLKELAIELRDRGTLSTKVRRVLHVSADVLPDGATEVADVLQYLAEKSFLTRVLNSKPWTVVFEDTELMHATLRMLVARQISFNTGYAEYGFSKELFEASPFLKPKGSIISDASHLLKVLSRERVSVLSDGLVPQALVTWGTREYLSIADQQTARPPIAVGPISAHELITFLKGSQS